MFRRLTHRPVSRAGVPTRDEGGAMTRRARSEAQIFQALASAGSEELRWGAASRCSRRLGGEERPYGAILHHQGEGILHLPVQELGLVPAIICFELIEQFVSVVI